MLKRIFDIRPRLRLWRQRRRKRQREQDEIDNALSYAYEKLWFFRGYQTVIIPMKPCWSSGCSSLAEYREQCNLRGVEVNYKLNLCSTESAKCNDCYLKQGAEKMKAQEEQMMQQAMLTEPDNAKWIVRSKLLRGVDDSHAESHQNAE